MFYKRLKKNCHLLIYEEHGLEENLNFEFIESNCVTVERDTKKNNNEIFIS
jgi:hypothetical protein